MAVGDAADITARLKSVLPAGWFPDTTPVLDGLLAGFADVGALIYAQLQYAKTQMRILSSTDGWIDYVAADYFGNAITRDIGESDTVFRSYILKNMFREKATRHAIDSVLFDFTGKHPVIVEGQLIPDVGACNVGTLACNEGGWCGSALPAEIWVDAYRGASGLSDAKIYSLIESVRPAGTIFWVNISSQITLLLQDQVLRVN